ncbi:MAG: flagellar motor switch protein FliG, partial [Mesorhizobium sp.]
MTSLTLTRPQKAAAILVAMGKPSASRLLKFFKQEELKALIEGARLLRTIPQTDLERIVAEFEAEFTEGAGLLDSADRLGTFLAGEHPQTSAMVLSKLAPQTAANVLLTMEKPIRSQIIKRMVTMANIPDAAARIVENQLRASVLSQKATRDTSVGQERVASVLNEMAKPELDELMQDLEEAGTPDLAGVRSRLFAFDDLPLLAQKARVLLFDGLSTELVTLAL